MREGHRGIARVPRYEVGCVNLPERLRRRHFAPGLPLPGGFFYVSSGSGIAASMYLVGTPSPSNGLPSAKCSGCRVNRAQSCFAARSQASPRYTGLVPPGSPSPGLPPPSGVPGRPNALPPTETLRTRSAPPRCIRSTCAIVSPNIPISVRFLNLARVLSPCQPCFPW